jgi:hypothetical protein
MMKHISYAGFYMTVNYLINLSYSILLDNIYNSKTQNLILRSGLNFFLNDIAKDWDSNLRPSNVGSIC